VSRSDEGAAIKLSTPPVCEARSTAALCRQPIEPRPHDPAAESELGADLFCAPRAFAAQIAGRTSSEVFSRRAQKGSWSLSRIAACYAQMNRIEEAAAVVAEVIRQRPDFFYFKAAASYLGWAEEGGTPGVIQNGLGAAATHSALRHKCEVRYRPLLRCFWG
jgi:hypothetical protein